jgi:hypothetical protein
MFGKKKQKADQPFLPFGDRRTMVLDEKFYVDVTDMEEGLKKFLGIHMVDEENKKFFSLTEVMDKIFEKWPELNDDYKSVVWFYMLTAPVVVKE